LIRIFANAWASGKIFGNIFLARECATWLAAE
jgi:hypothetical protein